MGILVIIVFVISVLYISCSVHVSDQGTLIKVMHLANNQQHADGSK